MLSREVATTLCLDEDERHLQVPVDLEKVLHLLRRVHEDAVDQDRNSIQAEIVAAASVYIADVELLVVSVAHDAVVGG